MTAEPTLALIETEVAPGSGPPLHTNASLDERFYVLEGRVTFRVGNAEFTSLPGASVFAARGTPHTYSNQSPERARVLAICTDDGVPGDGAVHYSEIVGPPLQAGSEDAQDLFVTRL